LNTRDLKIDRRVLRTRLALREALLSLMGEKDYDRITVEEITERANLGRATFYLHYKDREDLLLEEFADLIDELIQQLSHLSILEWQQQSLPQRPVLLVFQHVAENEKMYRLILAGEGRFQATERLRTIIVDAANELLHSKPELEEMLARNKLPVHFLANYLSGALVASICWWLEEYRSYEAEEMAGLFQRMLMPGIKQVLGIDPSQAA
jgi:AcrR family transcriptional regulator